MGIAASAEKSFFIRILTLLLVLLAGIFVTYLLYFLVLGFQVGFSLEELGRKVSDTVLNVSQMRIIQFLQSFCIFLFPPLILSRIYREDSKDFLSLWKPNVKEALMAMLSIIVSIPLLNVLVAWNAGMHLPAALQDMENWMRVQEDAATRVTEMLMAGTTVSDLLLNLLLVGVLAGLGEELFFRGLVLRIFTDALKPKTDGGTPAWVMHVSIWTVAIFFSAVHMQFFGFIPRLLLGAWLGYLLWWTGSIWVPALAHFTNNAFSTFAIYGQNKGLLTENPDRLGLDNTWWLSVISFVLLTGFVLYFSKSRKKI
jgi:uncharacterized protein